MVIRLIHFFNPELMFWNATTNQNNKLKNQRTKLKITGDMTIGDVIAKYPVTIEVLTANGIHCVGCHVQYWETLEQGFRGHGMNDEQVLFLITKLNEAVIEDEEPGSQNKDFIITKKAAEKLLELFKKEKKEDYGLRVAVVEGGCSGHSYALDFDKKAQKKDNIIEEKGIKVFIDDSTLRMIKGAKLDYIDSLMGSGFKISNPNAVDKCGCGQSFK